MNCANNLATCTSQYTGYYNVERYPYYLAHKSAGVSWMCISHNAQHATSGYFNRWDYGQSSNEVQYGEVTPPLYNLGNINFPIAIFYTTEESKADIEEFLLKPEISKLRSVVYTHKFDIPYESFYLGKDQQWFGREVIPLIEKYDPMNTQM
jgi:hypothetical protein